MRIEFCLDVLVVTGRNRVEPFNLVFQCHDGHGTPRV
jgi:hypothetical protein